MIGIAFFVLGHLIVSFRIHKFFLLYHLRISLICFCWTRNVLSVLIYVVLMSSHTLHGILPYLIVLFCGCHVLGSKFGIHILSISLLHFLSLVVDRLGLLVCDWELFLVISIGLFILYTIVRESQERLYTDIVSAD